MEDEKEQEVQPAVQPAAADVPSGTGSQLPEINFPSTEYPSDGPHQGCISAIIPFEKQEPQRRERKVRYASSFPTHWLRITIDLTDQNKSNGTLMQVDCEVSASGAIGSNLRKVLTRFGLLTEAGGRVSPSQLIGKVVEVYVQSRRGDNKNYKFPYVEHEDLTLPGQGRARQHPVEVPAGMEDIIVTSNTYKRRHQVTIVKEGQ